MRKSETKVKGDELRAWMDTARPGDDWCWDHQLFDSPEPDAVGDTGEIGDFQQKPVFIQRTGLFI